MIDQFDLFGLISSEVQRMKAIILVYLREKDFFKTLVYRNEKQEQNLYLARLISRGAGNQQPAA